MLTPKITRTVVSVLLTCTFAIAGAVQGSNKNPVSLGVRLGAGVNTVISDTKRDVYSTFVGLGGGLSFDIAYSVTDKFSLHSALGLDYRNFFATMSIRFCI